MNNLNDRLIPFGERNVLISEKVERKQISIVIPVKNEQQGIDSFFESFFSTHEIQEYPLEIIVVDNNSSPPIIIQDEYLGKGLSVHILRCRRQGAAAARNEGVNKAQGRWILFTDSDCVATETFISGYLDLNSGSIAYSGNIRSLRTSFLDRYYDSQEILIPPKATYGNLSEIPMYIVTANAIVYREAYKKIGGFNEQYPAAGGEDEDFSMRLWQAGNIGYAPDSLIRHDYKNGIFGFAKRFVNYGRGAFITEMIWKTPKRPRPFTPNKKHLPYQLVAYVQFCLMLYGYWKEGFNSND